MLRNMHMQSSNIDVRNALQLSNYPPSFSILIGKAKSPRLITSYCLTGAVLFEIDVDPYANVDRVNPSPAISRTQRSSLEESILTTDPRLMAKSNHSRPFTGPLKIIVVGEKRIAKPNDTRHPILLPHSIHSLERFPKPKERIRFNRIARKHFRLHFSRNAAVKSVKFDRSSFSSKIKHGD